MTFGERIAKYRLAHGLSQEGLAERLAVSRQSVSKWELDGAVPGVDKIIGLAEVFSVSTDELLRGDGVMAEDDTARGRYFGTDGFRGEANVELTSERAYRVGRFLGWYFGKGRGAERSGKRARIVIGKDTRRSSYMLEYSIVAGITASGADAYMLHVTTTPGVSFVTRTDEFDAGIMITASHNPYYDNGIKIINCYGEKLDEATTSLIEDYIDGRTERLRVGPDIPYATRERIGAIIDYASGRNRYLGYLISLASHSYSGLRIGIDAANGSGWMLARSLFSALGATLTVIGDEPDGLNINDGVGSTHIEALSRLVTENHLDLGFAFDGDCDRCIAVDHSGRVIDGDAIMYILACRLKDRGVLSSDTVVATVMSNSALDSALAAKGIRVVRTQVGDRFVYEEIKRGDLSLGGEQSGHIIIKKYATTGDGLLTAIMLTEELLERKSTLARLAEAYEPYPQYTVNLRVADKTAAVTDECVLAELSRIEEELRGDGRILLRASGTEPVVRIMTECRDTGAGVRYAERLERTLRERGHGVTL